LATASVQTLDECGANGGQIHCRRIVGIVFRQIVDGLDYGRRIAKRGKAPAGIAQRDILAAAALTHAWRHHARRHHAGRHHARHRQAHYAPQLLDAFACFVNALVAVFPIAGAELRRSAMHLFGDNTPQSRCDRFVPRQPI
jgi:hypothetical protein